MAATAFLVTPLTRVTNSFKNKDGETVTYHEVLALDPDGKIVVVRSSTKEPLASLVPGGGPIEVEGEVSKFTQITAPVIRPTGAPQDVQSW